MSEYVHVKHGFNPIYNENSKVLIPGTLPSVKSRETDFYYGHGRNRFWQVIAALTGAAVPVTVAEKKKMLLEGGIAIWDVIDECDIIGSDDSSIKNVVPANIKGLLDKTGIKRVYGNGAKACQLYDRFIKESTGVDIIKLPSTSPANAAWNLDRLIKEWSEKINF